MWRSSRNSWNVNKHFLPYAATHLHYVKCKVRVHEYTDGELAVSAGPRKLKSRLLEERQNKEVDDSDEFIALGPIPGWENEDFAIDKNMKKSLPIYD